jgi:hypothetical protein
VKCEDLILPCFLFFLPLLLLLLLLLLLHRRLSTPSSTTHDTRPVTQAHSTSEILCSSGFSFLVPHVPNSRFSICLHELRSHQHQLRQQTLLVKLIQEYRATILHSTYRHQRMAVQLHRITPRVIGRLPQMHCHHQQVQQRVAMIIGRCLPLPTMLHYHHLPPEHERSSK